MSADEVEPRESSLVDRAREGDRVAFGELVRRHQDTVHSLAVRLVGPDLAADVAHEAFIRAWRAVARFRGDAGFGTWIHRITVNTAWTLRRRAARHEAAPIEDVHADPRPTPDESIGVLDMRRDLKAALAELTDTHRIVVVLRDVEGWSTSEVADSLGITTTAAKVRLHRARRQLREILEAAS